MFENRIIVLHLSGGRSPRCDAGTLFLRLVIIIKKNGHVFGGKKDIVRYKQYALLIMIL